MPNPPRMLTHDGITLSMAAWAKRTSIPAGTIRSRIDQQGYTVAEALRTPTAAKFDPRKRAASPAPRPCPELKTHPTTGRAYCRWSARGKDHWRYFGEGGTAASHAAYRRFAAEWMARGEPPPPEGEQLFVCELVERYLDHVDTHYVKGDRFTSERYCQQAAVAVLAEVYPDLPAAEFKAANLRAVIAAMVAKGWSRKTTNKHRGRVCQCFRWGVAQDLVPPDVFERIRHVENLQRGRTKAPDYPKVTSAPVADVMATLPHLSNHPARQEVLSAMVRAHLLIGCRPHELCEMTAEAIDTSAAEWCYRYVAHKNQHRDGQEQPKLIWIGPRSQEIIRPYLTAAGATGRVWVLPKGEARSKVSPVSRTWYARYVALACAKASVKPWTPHQIRHTRATEVERVYESDEAAGAAIGDSPKVAAAVYVDPTDAVARRIARELG